MKLRNIITVAGLFLSSLGMVSCEDFLSETNPNNLTDENFPENAKDCEKMLIATYNTFRDVNLYAYVDENLRADTGVNVGYNGVRQNPNKPSALHNFTNSYSTVLSKWAALYTGIFAANQTLEAIEKVRPTLVLESDLKNVKSYEAEAHFFRGLYYFWLHNGYNKGSVPLVTKVPKDQSEYYQPLSSSAEVMAFYRSELKKALALGLLDGVQSSEQLGRVTAYSALAVLGKSYLYQASYLKNKVGDSKKVYTDMIAMGDKYGTSSYVYDGTFETKAIDNSTVFNTLRTPDSEISGVDDLYEIAESYFRAIIDSGKFTIDGVSVGDNMTTQGEFNKESILEVSYTTSFNSSYASASQYLYHSLGNNIADCPSSYEAIAPPYWLVEQYESDPVDMAREEMNFIPIELADDFNVTGDIVYDRLGTTYDRVYLNDDKTKETDDRYVMHIGKIGTATVTEYTLCKKSRSRTLPVADDAENDGWSDFTYTYIGNSATKVTFKGLTDQNSIKYIDGKPYRPVQYSLRASHSVALNGDETLPYYKKSVSEVASFSEATTGYFRKMTNWDIIDAEVNLTPTNASQVNIRLIRLSDIYLMYAESLIKGGSDNTDILEAIDYVNKIRYRAGVCLIGEQATSKSYANSTNVTFVQSSQFVSLQTGELLRDSGEDHLLIQKPITDAEHLMGHLMYVERPLELSFEGQSMRVNDMRRWGITRDRFKYLYSGDKYVMQGLAYLTDKFTVGTKWSKQYRPWEQPLQPDVVSDYKMASLNYNYDEDAYWPIPSSEVLSNPYIN